MASVLVFNGAPAAAQSSQAELEQKLQQAMELINELSSEVRAMKQRQQDPAPGGDVDPARLEKVEQAIQSVDERVSDVEDTVVDIDDKVGDRALVKAFDALELDIGGFFHNTFTDIEGEQGGARSFNNQTFEILVKAKLWEDWTGFFAQAFQRTAPVVFTDAQGRGTRA